MSEQAPTAEQKAAQLADRLGGAPVEPPSGEQGSPAPEGQQPDQQGDQKPPKPPWGDDFDAERAWNTIQTLRDESRQLKQEKTEREREKLSELDRAKAQLEDMKNELASAKLESARSRIIASKGLPPDAAKYLYGDTEEELERNAEGLKRMIGGAATKPTDFGAGARPNGGAVEDDFSSMIRRSAGRPS